jgi:hypothetical protein
MEQNIKQELLSVLKFYSNKKNYEFNTAWQALYDSKIEEDKGKKARIMLEKLNLWLKN